MNAVQFHSYGEPADVLKVVRTEIPQPGKNQVRLRVRAACLTAGDWKRVTGMLSMMDGALPMTVGFDVSGVVDAVGEGCGRLAVGDEVFGCVDIGDGGAAAEFAVVTEKMLWPKPAALSHRDAAALATVGATAHKALVADGQLQPGERVLVLGGGTGVGTAAIQVARAVGAAEVVTTARARNEERLRALGASRVVDYTAEAAPATQDFDLVVDCYGGRANYDAALRAVRPRGRVVRVAEDDLESAVSVGFVCSLLFRTARRALAGALRLRPRYTLSINMCAGEEVLPPVAELAASGALAASVAREVSLEEVPQAMQDVKEGLPQGRVVYVV